MTAFCILCLPPPIWLTYISGITSILALIVALFYFMKPRLTIKDESKEGGEIRIRCTNDNYFPVVIKDIKCDIVLSDNETFDITETIELYKDWITGIKHNDYYVFKSKKPKTKKYIKVRILALNYLGVKKYYEFPQSSLKMKIKDLLKRIYYALASGALLIVLVGLFGIIARDGNFYIIHPIRLPVIVAVVSFAFCWIMTRHNKRDGAILLSVIGITAVLSAIYAIGWVILAYDAGDEGYILSRWSTIMLWPCAACMAIAGFISDTKYNNILPNQSKAVSTMFRVLSWTGQIAIWGYGIAILLSVLGVIK